MERVTWELTLPYVESIANGNLLTGNSKRGSVSAQRMEWGGTWEGSSKGRGYMYTYG